MMDMAATGGLADSGGLSGRVAIVTGASTGIGRGIAMALAAAGASVVVGYQDNAAGADQTCASIAAAGGQARACAADTGTQSGADTLVSAAIDTWGRLDVMSCHAGVTAWGPFLDVTAEALDTVVATNIRGTFLSAQAAARRMVAQGQGGRLLLTASVTGVRAIANLSAYAMTRAAVEALARNLALELGAHGITANALVVGPIVNDRNLADDPDYAARWASILPVGRAGMATDVGAVAAFLASDASGFVTGASIPVDGGWIMTGQVPPAI